MLAREELNGEPAGTRDWTVGIRVYRGAVAEVRDFAALIKAYDKVAARGIVVGDAARAGGKSNPYRESMEDRARMVRNIALMGHSAGRAHRPPLPGRRAP